MTRPLSLIALAALVPLSACDWSQKKPQTLNVGEGSSTISAGGHQHLPGQLGESEPGAAKVVVGGERSLRLHGRGISRKRQTLI
jgi:hypothetical protein